MNADIERGTNRWGISGHEGSGHCRQLPQEIRRTLCIGHRVSQVVEEARWTQQALRTNCTEEWPGRRRGRERDGSVFYPLGIDPRTA